MHRHPQGAGIPADVQPVDGSDERPERGELPGSLAPAHKNSPTRVVPLSRAVLDPSGMFVTLYRANLGQHLTKLVQILVRGTPPTGLKSTNGAFLAGSGGVAGTDACSSFRCELPARRSAVSRIAGTEVLPRRSMPLKMIALKKLPGDPGRDIPGVRERFPTEPLLRRSAAQH